MPIPTTIDELDPVAANNSPAGTEEVGTDMDNYIRALSAFIAQLYGIVDGPYVYENLSAFRAIVQSGQTSSTTYQKVQFTSLTGSTDYSTSTYIATAPRTGWYVVNSKIEIINTSGSPQTISLLLDNGGAQLSREEVTIAAGAVGTYRFNTTRKFTVGAAVSIQFNDAYSNFEVLSNSDFSWAYIGD